MRTGFLSLLLFLEFTTTLTKKVVPLEFERRKSKTGLQHRYHKRDKTVEVGLGNAQYLYFANVTVGTPAQFIELQVDTGSADVWMSDSDARYCEQSYYDCLGGTFNPKKSRTYDPLTSGPEFHITYLDGSYSKGTYFKDTLRIGGSKLSNMQMGLATSTNLGTGIIGLAFSADESVCANTYLGGCDQYPSFLEQMVSQGYISSQAYSLWLNDEYALYGSILFGGVDTSKYTGKLTTLPVQPDSYSHAYTSFTVVLSDFSIKDVDGSITHKTTLNTPAILDSGTSVTLLPDSLANELIKQVHAEYNAEYQIYLVSCKYGNADAYYQFQFGGSNGPIINLPVGQMFEPLTDTNGSPVTLPNGDLGCEFGLQPTKGRPVILGDTFLRAAYVVYDIDNREVSIAQTVFNATGSSILEIKAGPNGVPDVSGTASAASAVQTASVRGGVGAGGIGYGSLSDFSAQTFTVDASAPFGNPVFGGQSTGGAAVVRAGGGAQSLGLTVAALLVAAVTVLVGMSSVVVLM